jgi:O-antigen/teichoic acid export membrane protein
LSPPPENTNTNTQTIARNSFWYGLELLAGIGAIVLTSIIVANAVGKEVLGPYIYVGWLTNITAGIGSSGLAVTTRKYMSEYLNRGEGGIARAVYSYALRLQVLIAMAVTTVGLPLALLAGRPGYRLVSAVLVMSMAPRIVGSIPSLANVAGERMQRNTGPSMIGSAINVSLTLFSLWMGWGLRGIAFSFMLGSAVEAGLKLYSVRRWLAPTPIGTISPELKKRMTSYSGQGLVLMVLNIVVWDKSDLLILNWMNPDVGQVTFFATAFSYTDKLLMLPNAFAGSLGATMMAQFGRGEERVREIMIAGAKYGFLMALPLLVGMACISGQFITLAYHPKIQPLQFQPMIPVLMLAALLAIPKALIAAPTSLLQTVEKQVPLIQIGCLCGVVDIGLDFLLTPGYGALGATLANGLAQTLAAVLLWRWVYRNYSRDLRLLEFGRIALSGALMAAAVVLVQRLVPLAGFPALALSIATGALAWLAALRLTGAINHADGERLRHLGRRLPGGMRPILDRCVSLLSTEAVS